MAWRNNTFSLHVHVGVRDIDRAVRVCDRLRPVLPLLLAISANSPYLDGRDSGLHSARTQTFTKSFPRCGIPDAFGGWDAYREYIEFLLRTNSIVEFTQIWWSVRPALRLRHGRGADLRRAGDRAGVRGAGGADGGLHRPGAARRGRGRAVRRPGAAADRGEHVAGDPLRARRPADRPRARARSTRRARRSSGWPRGPSRCAPSSGSSSSFPERNGAQRQRAHDRGRGEPRGGLRGVGGGDGETYRRRWWCERPEQTIRWPAGSSRARRSCAPPTRPN